MRHIFLIGMPGSGKSTSGKRFAKELGWSFADLDKLIQIKTGKTISSIFAEEGELAFREYEQQALHETILSEKMVIACGGGTAAWFGNLAWMQQHGLVVWLDIAIQELKRRILTGKAERPMFKGLSESETEQQLQELFEKRGPFFKHANYRVSSERELLELAAMLRHRLPNA